MKLHPVILAVPVLFVVLLTALIWFRFDNSIFASRNEPKLFKSERYPPVTPEEKAMWAWWVRMNQEDPQFEWKRPISFYGKVIDQYSQPVPNAQVEFQWTNISREGTGTAETSSDSNGLFSLIGVHGKILGVDINKSGYLDWPKSSRQGFEYAEFFNVNFYVPDPNHPVIFKLWKINPNAEPLIRNWISCEIKNNQTKYLILKTGNSFDSGSNSDLAIQISSSIPNTEAKFNYTVTISTPNGGGMVESSDDFMVQAPDSGYQDLVEVTQDANAPIFSRGFSKQFYLKTGGGNYAAIDLTMSLNNDGSGGRAQVSCYYNPSGSKNLEYDPAKQINKQ